MSDNQVFDLEDERNEETGVQSSDTVADRAFELENDQYVNQGDDQQGDVANESEAAESQSDPSSVNEQERLRQPRAQSFRRRLRNQLSFMPTAIYLVLVGAFLIGRHEGVEGWPDYSDFTLVGAGILVLAFSAVSHALLFGRRERGLLFVGLLIWVTAGTLAVLLAFFEDSPDFAEWWPIFLVALGITLLLTFLLERLHDARLVLLSLIVLVAAATSYVVTSGGVAEDRVTDAGDYWPLLFAVFGVGLLPLVFRRRTG